METNSVTGLEAANNISIINFETFINSTEADFLEWKFYDNSFYDAALSLFPNDHF